MSDKLNHKVGICYIDLFHGIDCLYVCFFLCGFDSPFELVEENRNVCVFLLFVFFCVFLLNYCGHKMFFVVFKQSRKCTTILKFGISQNQTAPRMKESDPSYTSLNERESKAKLLQNL